MAPHRRRKPIALKLGQDLASLPLKHPPREIFAQAVARGVNVDVAYREAGYTGGPASRRELRCSADVDARIRWLLVQRIESDAKERAKLVCVEIDAKSRMIAELKSIAYADIGDIAQWDKKPVYDEEGTLKGYEDHVTFTPSRLLTKAQRGAVKGISKQSTKYGSQIKLDMTGKIEAIGLLAKVLGFAAEPAPSAITNTQVNVGQVNLGQDNAREGLRRLAFAIEKIARDREAIEAKPETEIHVRETVNPSPEP